MKLKILFTVLISLILLFVLMALLPVFYKDKLLVKVKNTINSEIAAKVDFGDFKVSVFSKFPSVELELQNISVVGVKSFEKDTLFSAVSISTKISLFEMIRNKGLELTSLIIENPKVFLKVDAAGAVNWDITKADVYETKIVETGTSKPDEAFSMKLNDIQINQLNLVYDDLEMPMKVQFRNTDINSTGKVTGSKTTFKLSGISEEFVFEYDSVKYISKTRVSAETELVADLDKMKFNFNGGKMNINKLPLTVEGSFEIPTDSMFFDLGFKSEKSNFATLLALVPADYQKYIEKAEINGSAEFSLSIKGLFYEEIYPAFDLLIAADNANFKYVDLPEKIDNISVLVRIQKPEGDLNLLKANVEKAKATIRSNPVSFTLAASELLTDPDINMSFDGTIDFNSLKNALPIDSLNISGILTAKMKLAGRMSAVEKNDFEKFQSNGEASLQNFRIDSNQLTKPVEISKGQITATTKQISVEQFEGKIGQSDFSLRGNVSNYLAYMFKNGVLKGNFNLNSSYMNFNELSNIQNPVNASKKSETTEVKPISESKNLRDSVSSFQVPDKLEIVFITDIKKAVYDKMPINNMAGQVNVKNRKMELANLVMEIMGGKLGVNGSYTSNAENKPLFDFRMNLESADLPTVYKSVSTLQRYAPIASHTQGKISAQFVLSGVMNKKMEIIPASLNGLGLLNTQNLAIIESPVFDQIRGLIKKEKLKNVKVDDFTAKFQFENGQLNLNPFKTNIADQQTTIYGNLSAAGEINLNLDFLVNREDLGSDINKGLGFLPGSQNIKMIEASVILKGPVKKPVLSLDLSKAKTQIEQEVKKAATEEIKESVKKIGDELKKLFK